MQHPTLRHSNHDMFESLRRWMGIETFDEVLPIELTLAAMHEAGVTAGLTAAWYGPEGLLISNDEVASSSRGRKGCSCPSPAPTSAGRWRPSASCATESSRGSLRSDWCRGCGSHRRRTGAITRCTRRVSTWGIPFCTQVGHTGPLRPSETSRPIPYIDQVAIDFPELVIVCGHIGYPWTTEMIAVADKHPNVYIDTSAYAAHRYPAELVDYLKGRGRHKVMFATNYPMMTPARAPERLDDLGLTAETRDAFLHANARRVFAL